MFEGIKKLLGDENAGALKSASVIVGRVNDLEEEYEKLSDTDLKAKTAEFKERLKKEESLNDLMPEAFAAVREASKRTLGQRHYDVQLIGGAVLHNGDIAEMRTGEGKTLVATLPVYLNALTGKGVHLVTVNDYLSRRDAVWMGQIYSFLGLSIAVINHEISYMYDSSPGKEEDKERDEKGDHRVVEEFLSICTRQEAYAADITYGTNNEFGFDYLRDNIAYKKEDLRQRTSEDGGYNFAIVDEIDSILIDEARTPLIISAPAADAEKLYGQFAQIASTLNRDTDFTVDEKLKAIQLTDEGIEKVQRSLGIDNIYTDKGIKYVHHLETAVRAKALFILDKDYVIQEGEVIIVDEFTGRMQPGRRWSEGLHQAMEAKEGVDVQQESRTFASITYQNYFKNYAKLSGMTGTAMTSSEEFYKVYGLNTVEVPTNQDIKRLDHEDQIFQTENGKFTAIARKVKEINEKGQPMLIGTASVEKNELLSAYLTKEGIKHELLNAKNHEREGSIISDAGRKGAVTVATNMAGRGVDISLGGESATKEDAEAVRSLGGLFVLGTERHEARRIDNQLRGRSGRQGDSGETQFFVSLEDSLMRVFASDTIKGMMGRFGIAEDEPIQNKMITRSLETAQKKIEGFHFDSRKQVLAYDDVLNLQRKTLYERRRNILLGTDEKVEEELALTLSGDEEATKIVSDKKSLIGDEGYFASLRRVLLQTLDMLWVDHLETMDYLRGSVNLRAYGQRDPLLEYKKEGLRLYNDLEYAYQENVIKLLPQLSGDMFVRRESQEMRETQEGAENLGKRDGNDKARAAQRTKENSIGRNEPCPCGSGKKYKKCGLANSEEHQKRTQGVV
ncbi:preprotein translocase subunit SecA [Candidatus Kaiserbacteria bacterium]|nr:MAG: preprotein translocase subunit SecA [Candidatus Kaiserbacteria bacterium]